MVLMSQGYAIKPLPAVAHATVCLGVGNLLQVSHDRAFMTRVHDVASSSCLV